MRHLNLYCTQRYSGCCSVVRGLFALGAEWVCAHSERTTVCGSRSSRETRSCTRLKREGGVVIGSPTAVHIHSLATYRRYTSCLFIRLYPMPSLPLAVLLSDGIVFARPLNKSIGRCRRTRAFVPFEQHAATEAPGSLTPRTSAAERDTAFTLVCPQLIYFAGVIVSGNSR